MDAGKEAFLAIRNEDKDWYFVFVLGWFLDLVEKGSGSVGTFSVFDFKVEAGVGAIARGSVVSSGGS